MTKIRRKTGQVGENAARSYLEKLGYKVVDTNYRCPLGEIDIVARDNDTTVIVEVRTRTGSGFGIPEESITPGKARRLRRLALYYLQSVYRREVPCRIDLVAVTINSATHNVVRVNHIQNIISG